MPKELLLVGLVFLLGIYLLAIMRWRESLEEDTYVSYKRNLAKRRRFYRNDYLKSGYWNQLKNEVKAKHPYCEDCGGTEDLDAHHLFYRVNGKSVLYHEREYPGCLIVLCRPCHKRRHGG